MPLDGQRDIATRLAIAALVGLAAGLEREWSGHASGPDARFAGLRTFCLVGLLGRHRGNSGVVVASPDGDRDGWRRRRPLRRGVCRRGAEAGRLARWNDRGRRARNSGARCASRIGWIGIAAGAGAIVVLLLSEKARLHWLVRQLSEPELRAGVQFAVLAIVVLPLLPPGPFFGDLEIKPRTLWAIVLLFSALNFGGFVARRLMGARRGLSIAGALGGVVSSTAVTLTFSRMSRTDDDLGTSLARGVLAACTVLIPRVLLVSAFLNPAVSLALLPMLALPLVVGLAFTFLGRGSERATPRAAAQTTANPLRLMTAIQMAVAFQAAMIAVMFTQRLWGNTGVYSGATILGLTDVDALTVSMSRQEAGLATNVAAHAVAIGVLANTILKLAVATTVGRAAYRRRTAAGLAALAASTAVGILVA